MNVHDFEAKSITGDTISLKDYKGKLLLIVNTASKCGFTPQFEGLENLYQTYKDDLEILGFPCNQFKGQDPGTNAEIQSFCQLNYGVTFQLFEKIDVRGENAHPLFKYLCDVKPFPGFDLNIDIQKKFSDITKDLYPEYYDDNSIKWNFTKFLVDREGNVVARYEPWITPEELVSEINAQLK